VTWVGCEQQAGRRAGRYWLIGASVSFGLAVIVGAIAL
jgi:hypothetical protein